MDFSLRVPETIQAFSSEPYGFGDDLANWSNHESKFQVNYQLNSRWTLNSSLRVFWGFPGAKDQAEYNKAILDGGDKAVNSLGLSEKGYQKPFNESAFLSFALIYRAKENIDARVDFHNVLGWLDKDYNKRNYVLRMSEYRAEAAAISLSLRYSF